MGTQDFYIFRHGQTDLNAQQKWQGSGVDALLNDEGKNQAQLLFKKISEKHINLTALYCSNLLRAVQTADYVANSNEKKLNYTVMYDLRECCFGECEGLTFEEVYQKYGQEFVEDFLFPNQNTWDKCFAGGESKQQVFKRVYGCLMQIMAMNNSEKDNRFGIVCHAGVISSLQCGLSLKDVCYENCSILHLRFNEITNQFVQVFD